jgi:hypothetical protein
LGSFFQEGRRLQADGDGVPDRGGVPAGAGAAGAPRRGGAGAAVVEAIPVPPGARAGGRARRLRLRRRLRAGPPPQPARRAERGDRVPGHAAPRADHPARRRGRAAPARVEQPARLRAPVSRRAGAARHSGPLRPGERVHLRPLARRRLRAPGGPHAHGVAPPPPAGVARVPPLQRAVPVAAQGRAVRGQDGGLPAQGRADRRRHRRQVARQGAPQRGLRQLHTRLYQAREQQEVVMIAIQSGARKLTSNRPTKRTLYL